MTGKQKIEAAFSSGGTKEIPAVICYEDIFIRDHWRQLTACPWWIRMEYDINRQLLWRREVFDKIGQDWFLVYNFGSDEDRQNIAVEARAEGVFISDRRTGKEEKLEEPEIGGGKRYIETRLSGNSLETPDDIDEYLSRHKLYESTAYGSHKMSSTLVEEFSGLCPTGFASTPLLDCFFMWSFEDAMTKIATQPELIDYACRKNFERELQNVRRAALTRASVVFIQDAYTDMINPEDFKKFDIRYTSRLIEEIRSLGMKSVYYFTGNPAGKLEHIIAMGADAISFEESKKNFKMNIEELAEKVHGSCTLLGNLDSIGVLQDGTEEELRTEIKRQLSAGRKNKSRFIMSLGSPVTPETPNERVRLYCDLVHELGKL